MLMFAYVDLLWEALDLFERDVSEPMMAVLAASCSPIYTLIGRSSLRYCLIFSTEDHSQLTNIIPPHENVS